MKYQQLAPFQKHLQQSGATGGHSSVFLLVASNSAERDKIAKEVVSALTSQHGQVDQMRYQAEQAGVHVALEELKTLSFFGRPKVVYYDGLHLLKKGDLEQLLDYVEKPFSSVYLILGSQSSKGLNDFYTRGKKELIACDLTAERPAALRSRLQQDLFKQIQQEGKQISPQAMDLLLERAGSDRSQLEQEVKKLICYLGNEGKIEASHVQALVPFQKQVYLFELADRILWGCDGGYLNSHDAKELIFPLISQLKRQLQQGLVLAHLRARKLSISEIARFVPEMKPFVLDKWMEKLNRTNLAFLRQALDVLFEIELLSKNSALDPVFIADLLVSKLAVLKKSSYALSAP